jgi:hypothetical protein
VAGDGVFAIANFFDSNGGTRSSGALEKPTALFCRLITAHSAIL